MELDLDNCRYCSEVSKIQGEDPIGTAGVAEEWLIVEVPRPWKKDIWNNKPIYKPLIGILIELEQNNPNLSLRLMAIASDKEYSTPDQIRVFYYFRPAKMFANYEKQEYIVNPSELISLVRAIFFEPHKLDQFQRRNTSHIREILVCTHTQVDTACGRYGTPLYQQIRKNYSSDNLRVWQTSHFGGHKFAPTLIDFPSGKFWGHLEPEILDTLIYKQGNLSDLKSYYRGWSGLKQAGQIAEREVWLQEGWEWEDYPKSARIIAKDEGTFLKRLLKKILKLIPSRKSQFLLQKLERDINWVEILIEYIAPNQNTKQTYQVRIEIKGKVTTASKTTKPMELKPVKQYQVTNIVKIPTLQQREKVMSNK